MQLITITGYLSRDPELATAGDGEVCRLNIPVKQGWGDREQTNWFRASVWGKRAKTVSEKCRKGTKVTVVGELVIGEYQGKPQYDIRVNDVDWVQPASAPERGNGGSGNASRSRAPADDGWDEDEIPFVSSDIALERRAH